MLCEKCNNDSNVIDSRPVGNLIRRRRVCKSCGFSWKTFEISTSLRVEDFAAANGVPLPKSSKSERNAYIMKMCADGATAKEIAIHSNLTVVRVRQIIRTVALRESVAALERLISEGHNPEGAAAQQARAAIRLARPASSQVEAA